MARHAIWHLVLEEPHLRSLLNRPDLAGTWKGPPCQTNRSRAVHKLRRVRALIVPIKSFVRAKVRLSSVLSNSVREQFARNMAANVIAAHDEMPVYVVCDDGVVADFAIAAGAFVLWTPRFGLSGAVNAAIEHLGRRGITLAVVAHADLPFAHSLGTFGEEEEITLAPDRHRDGTNVAAVPTNLGFRFSYGPRSFDRHRHEAERFALSPRIIDDWRLATDIDVPDDLGLMFDFIAEGLDEVRFELPTRRDAASPTTLVRNDGEPRQP